MVEGAEQLTRSRLRSAQRIAVTQRPHQETATQQVAATEPVVHHQGRQGGRSGHDEARPAASTSCWAARVRGVGAAQWSRMAFLREPLTGTQGSSNDGHGAVLVMTCALEAMAPGTRAPGLTPCIEGQQGCAPTLDTRHLLVEPLHRVLG
jgi:hypothetical protein